MNFMKVIFLSSIFFMLGILAGLALSRGELLSMNTLSLQQHPSTLVVLIVTMVAGLVLIIKPDNNDK
ncbi:MAG: hypothetical protein GY781_03820 [Gammaproteobacteria bacterium]|nr:hypothetical protein [Gammaproteobacteria bacterium]